jgi:hypothetical protein
MRQERKKGMARRTAQNWKYPKPLPIATFDIETNNIGDGESLDVRMACVYYGDGIYHHSYTAETLVEQFFTCKNPYRYHAHNGARFDFSLILEAIFVYAGKYGYSVHPCVQGEDRLIAVTTRNGKKKIFELADSLALIPMPLKDVAAVFATTQKGHKVFDNDHSFNPDDALDVEYLHNDVLSLYEALTTVSTLVLDELGVPLSLTAGATSLNAWYAHIPIGHRYFRLNAEYEAYAREGYYGGYVYPGQDIEVHENVVSLDINGAYAAIMRQGVPTGWCSYVKRYYNEYPGMYHVIVTAPEGIKRPIVICREPNGNLSYPTGTFETKIGNRTIERARAKGYTIEIVDGLIWERIEYPFDELLDKFERLEFEEGGIKKALVKIFRNAIYGKFGMKSESKRWHVALDGEIPDGSILLINEETGEANPYVYATEEKSDADYIMPHWAAWITEGQRLYLDELMGVFENIRYGDTDSLYVDIAEFEEKKHLLPMNGRYGSLKVEIYWKEFVSHGPKNYEGIDFDGVYHGKCKGIKRTLRTLQEYGNYDLLNLPAYTMTTVRSGFMTMTHPEKKPVSKLTRKMSSLLNSKAWKLQGTQIVPLHKTYDRLQLE